MTRSKIQLSVAETELISNADLILTKNKALEKIRMLLEQAQQLMQAYASRHQLHETPAFQNPPKISRGELYRGLPWLMLDYPRFFTRERVFAIRSLFWWGHFFSSTLHVSQDAFLTQRLSTAYDPLQQQHYIGVNPDPWQHHFEKDNYKAIREVPKPLWMQQLQAREHIKIARTWPLHEWEPIPEMLFENWKKMLELISYPGGETGLSPGSPRA